MAHVTEARGSGCWGSDPVQEWSVEGVGAALGDRRFGGAGAAFFVLLFLCVSTHPSLGRDIGEEAFCVRGLWKGPVGCVHRSMAGGESPGPHYLESVQFEQG